jgi:hypothetical protein
MKSAIAATPLPFFRSGVRIPGLDQGWIIFLTIKTSSWNHKEQENGSFYFSPLFICRILDLKKMFGQDPRSGMKNFRIPIRDRG